MPDRSQTTRQGTTVPILARLSSCPNSLAQLHEQASSSRCVSQPPDNPAGAAEILRLRSQIGRLQQYASNISDGQGWINSGSRAIGSVIAALQVARCCVLERASGLAGYAVSSQALSSQALSSQVSLINQELLRLSATTYSGQYVFSGTCVTKPYPRAYLGDYTYAGSAKGVKRYVAPGQNQTVSITGDRVFGAGSRPGAAGVVGSSVFAVLGQVANDLACGITAALSGRDLAQLESWVEQATRAQGEMAVLDASLEASSAWVADMALSLQQQVANIQSANEAEVLSELAFAEASYQGAIEIAAKINQASLAQFLS